MLHGQPCSSPPLPHHFPPQPPSASFTFPYSRLFHQSLQLSVPAPLHNLPPASSEKWLHASIGFDCCCSFVIGKTDNRYESKKTQFSTVNQIQAASIEFHPPQGITVQGTFDTDRQQIINRNIIMAIGTMRKSTLNEQA